MVRAKKSDVGKAMAKMAEGYFAPLSEAPVIPGIESMEDWQQLRDRLLADYAPVGALETELAERAASLFWRLRRPARYEREYISASIERVPEDFHMRSLNRFMPRTRKEADARVESVERSLQLLAMMDEATPLDGASDDDIATIFEALSDDPELSRMLEDSMPGFEEGMVNADNWTAQLLRAAFKTIASRAEMTPGDLLVYAVNRLYALREERSEERVAMFAEQDRMRRERSLPDAHTLHAITRYETSLHRALMQTMHELEAAQARRRGQTTPLLRGEVHLVAET